MGTQQLGSQCPVGRQRRLSTHERRSVPFPAILADELAASMVGKARDALVFTDMRSGGLRNSNWRARGFAPAVAKCQKADESFPSITPHDLRHTAASVAVSAGANVKAVQRRLGHAKASMTLDTYADLFAKGFATHRVPAARRPQPKAAALRFFDTRPEDRGGTA